MHILPSAPQAESSAANVCLQSSHILINLFTGNTPWSLFSKESFLLQMPTCGPCHSSGTPVWAGQAATFHRKEGAAPWGTVCCPSVLSSAPCLEQ